MVRSESGYAGESSRPAVLASYSTQPRTGRRGYRGKASCRQSQKTEPFAVTMERALRQLRQSPTAS